MVWRIKLVNCTYKGQCPEIPPALMHTSIAAGRCERCDYNSSRKVRGRRSRKR